jgi:glycosyltransferase involved in cell wall biosynthesis
MGTYNGRAYLEEQLDSLEKQTHTNWQLIVSDDGSTDNTHSLLEKYQSKWPEGKLITRSGPQQGFCQNFLSMACDKNIKADYFAFCDQDDVWLPKKLEEAVKNIGNNETPNVAYVYCGPTIYVDTNLKHIGYSDLYLLPKVFENALVQSIVGGNTMVFNNAGKKLLENIGIKQVASHDWWLYQIATGSGGKVFYDTESYVLYRQHADALVGGGFILRDKLARIKAFILGRFKKSNDQNIDALTSIEYLLKMDSLKTLREFKLIRHASFFNRFLFILKCPLFRQRQLQTLVLKIAILFKMA